MGREIELKIPLTEEEYSTLYEMMDDKREVPGIKFTGEIVHLYKKDEYYSRFNSHAERMEAGEPQCIRLRTDTSYDKATGKEEKINYFTLKRKTRENGIEVNREDETVVEEPDVLRDFFAVAGYIKWFSKEKNAFSSYLYSDTLPGVAFHAELERVNNMPYMEIEVTDESKSPDEIKKALENTVSAIGLNPQNKDSRSWVQILTEK